MKKLFLLLTLTAFGLGLWAQTAIQPSGTGTSGSPYQIATWENLYWISQNSGEWSKHYIQTADIDFADATPAIDTWDGGAGFTPIGNSTTIFNGTYNGQNHSISNLFINRNTSDDQGLFGQNRGTLSNIKIDDANITGKDKVGLLVGFNRYSSASITNCSSSGNVFGKEMVGGLVGLHESTATINSCFSSCHVEGEYRVGGLVGRSNGGIFNNSFATGNVVGTGNGGTSNAGGLLGGLVGSGQVTNCYSTGNVSGKSNTGGFVGSMNGSVISKSYSTGNVVTEGASAGGFIGLQTTGTVENCYSLGNVIRTDGSSTWNGGFVGRNWRGKIINSYAKGKVEYTNGTNPTNRGFAGPPDTGDDYEMTDNFWDTETSLQSSTDGNATGKTTAQMKTQSTFTDAGWDFSTIWVIGGLNDGYPYLDETTTPAGSGTVGDPYQIASFENLCWLAAKSSRWDKHYIQTANIDMAATGQGGSWGSEGWTPIGTKANPFKGTYDGKGFLIQNIYINRPSADYQGLFGAMVGTASNKAILRNIKIEGVDITAEGRVGSLLGKVDDNHHTLIENCQALNGTVKGQYTTGGLVGANNGTLTGPPASNQTLLQYCFADIDVSFTGTGAKVDIKIGGLVGCGQRGTIRNSYALGSVNGINGSHKADRVGGLAGCIDQGSITNSFALGVVTGDNTNVGALTGRGAGLGVSDGITNSFYDAANWQSGFNTLGTSKTVTDLKTQSTFTSAGWDFDNIWAIDPSKNNGYPYLLVNPPSGNTPVPVVEKEFDGDTDNNWNVAGNWSTDAVPTPSSIATIPSDAEVVIPDGYGANALDLYIEPNASLTMNGTGTLTVAGNLYIHADENGTGSLIDNGSLTVSGQVFVQKYLPSNTYGWTVAAPLNAADTSAFNGSNGVYYYDPLIPDWSNDYDDSDDIETMRGYWTKFPDNKTLEFNTGVLHTGEIIYDEFYRTESYGNGNMGWNFIGNPYPSGISWDEVVALNGGYTDDKFTDDTKLNAHVFISDNDGGYLSFVGGTGQTGFADGIIPPATAFWVQVYRGDSDDNFDDNNPIADAKLTLDNSVRVHTSTGGTKNASNIANVIRLILSNDNHSNEAIVRLRNGATMAFDPAYDAVKMFSNNASHAQLYSIIENNEKLAINAIPHNITEAVSIPLGYKNEQGSTLTITANNLVSMDSNLSIYLEDKHTGIMQDLRADNVYNFSINATQDEERFVLHLARTNAGLTYNNTEAAIDIYTYQNALYINQTSENTVLSVYNMLGQEVYTSQLTHSGLHKIDLNVVVGHYIVSVVSNGAVKTQKVFVE